MNHVFEINDELYAFHHDTKTVYGWHGTPENGYVSCIPMFVKGGLDWFYYGTNRTKMIPIEIADVIEAERERMGAE